MKAFNKLTVATLLCTSAALGYSSVASAYYSYNNTYNDPFDFFTDTDNGWTMFADDDGETADQGGQPFDTEYFFYKYSNDGTNKTLSIGLQSGFDLRDGEYNGYYGGDLALSFDGAVGGDSSNNYGYEYAVDFGLTSKNWSGDKVATNNADSYGRDDAGLYRVGANGWDNDILHNESSPFAMDEGDLLQEITSWDYSGYAHSENSVGDNAYGKGWADNDNPYKDDLRSYFRVVTFDLSHITGLSDNFTVDAHWTMSCGNDEINGRFNVVDSSNPPPQAVPEPASLLLMGIGTLGLASGLRRRRKAI